MGGLDKPKSGETNENGWGPVAIMLVISLAISSAISWCDRRDLDCNYKSLCTALAEGTDLGDVDYENALEKGPYFGRGSDLKFGVDPTITMCAEIDIAVTRESVWEALSNTTSFRTVPVDVIREVQDSLSDDLVQKALEDANDAERVRAFAAMVAK